MPRPGGVPKNTCALVVNRPPPQPIRNHLAHVDEVVQPIDRRYKKIIGYNCWKPGHYVGNCMKDRVYFMCNIPGHHMNNCQEWAQPIPMA
jgi:hypothetical protein